MAADTLGRDIGAVSGTRPGTVVGSVADTAASAVVAAVGRPLLGKRPYGGVICRAVAGEVVAAAAAVDCS